MKPKWETLLSWFQVEKYQPALIEGISYFVNKYNYKIENLPPKDELKLFLQELKEKQILSTKKRMIDEALDNIDIFYEPQCK